MVQAANLALDRSRVTGEQEFVRSTAETLDRAAAEPDRHVLNTIAIMQEPI
jgi:hypothetical protein